MSQGLQTTFRFLAETENDAASPVLLAALDVPRQAVREGALRALFQRRSAVGLREIVRRLHTLDDSGRAIVHEHGPRLAPALRDAVLSKEPQMCANGCEAALWLREYDLIPTLVNALEDATNPHAGLAASTMLSLAELLYDELTTTVDRRRQRDPQIVRRNALQALEQSVMRFGRHRRSESLEAFLVLASRENAVLGKILADPRHASFVPLVQLLTHSPRAGVMRLLLGFLDDPSAPSAAISALMHRTDLRFIGLLLRKIGQEPSATARANLARVDSVPWMRDDPSAWQQLDEAGQHSLVRLVMATSMKRLAAFEILREIALRGNAGGRRAAIEALIGFNGAEANSLVLRALKDSDPRVQALAAAQLRPRGIPGALATLIELIDDPHPLVRQAVRESLTEFSFERFILAFDILDEEVRRSTGMLVRKIDPETMPCLRAELGAAVARRRMRAVSMAVAMQVVPDVEDLVIDLACDDDHLVRCEAIRALAYARSPIARMTLDEARYDRSPSVREAAVATLRKLDTADLGAALHRAPQALRELEEIPDALRP